MLDGNDADDEHGANIMTTQRIRSIQGAIADCNRQFALKGARSADLRPAEIAKLLELLDWYIVHRVSKVKENIIKHKS